MKNETMRYSESFKLQVVSELEAETLRLRSALADAHMDIRLGNAYMEIACEADGIEYVGSFKKNRYVAVNKVSNLN